MKTLQPPEGDGVGGLGSGCLVSHSSGFGCRKPEVCMEHVVFFELDLTVVQDGSEFVMVQESLLLTVVCLS